jgi:energy-coupling factor transport system substrate-specific component
MVTLFRAWPDLGHPRRGGSGRPAQELKHLHRLLSAAIYGLAGVIGLVAFTYPLFLGQLQQVEGAGGSEMGGIRLTDAPVLTMVLLILCLVVLLVEVQGQAVNAKIVAALGVLVAVASVLRFLETAIPGPGGFSPIFVPIILAGYVYGARFGLLMGTLTLLTSALLTAGVGPWLPYQMYAAGWIGMTAGWLPRPGNKRVELLMLAIFAFVWGLLFGAILNLYFWPFIAGDNATSWQADEGMSQMLARYGAFYLTTSFAWDLVRGAGNTIIILALGIPAVKALDRFRDRLRFELV